MAVFLPEHRLDHRDKIKLAFTQVNALLCVCVSLVF